MKKLGNSKAKDKKNAQQPRKKKKDKDLLETLGASDRLFDIKKELKIYSQDYEIVNKTLNLKREDTLRYLKKI